MAVTGITASGKSTLASELCGGVRALGVDCVSVPVDGFHRPKAVRHARGRESAEGYYRDAYDYDLLIARVLEPLGPGGDGSYVSRAFDLERDAPVDETPERAAPGSIVILDASFLLREEIRDYFDYRIFVQASFEAARKRGVARDREALGGETQAQRLYRVRYHEAQKIYFREAQPLNRADAVVINDDVRSVAVCAHRKLGGARNPHVRVSRVTTMARS